MQIKIPKGAEKYILFQRTEYLTFARTKNIFGRLLYSILSIVCSFNNYVSLEAYFFSKKIARAYSDDMHNEFETFKAYLPDRIQTALDIGCGVAGIDVLLAKHFNFKAELFLLDKTAIDKKVYYLFEEKGSNYNSLKTAQDLLELNGVPSDMVYTQEATDDNEILFKETFDLVLSLISWGFHYPIKTYLEEVYEHMHSGSLLIIDVRNGTDGEDLLRQKFGSVKVLFDKEKYKRFLVLKK